MKIDESFLNSPHHHSHKTTQQQQQHHHIPFEKPSLNFLSNRLNNGLYLVFTFKLFNYFNKNIKLIQMKTFKTLMDLLNHVVF